MVNYNSHNITGMSYNGHTIKKAYGCDGKLVWENNPCGSYMLSYHRQYGQGETFTIPYNGRTEIPYDAVDYEKTYDLKIFDLNFGPCVNSIAVQAFQNIIATPEELHIPSNIKSIGECAFDGNSGLTVYMEGLIPPIIYEHSFICDYCTGKPKFYVPCEVLDRYKAAWPNYANDISATTSCAQLPTHDEITYSYIRKSNEGVSEIPNIVSNEGYSNPKYEIELNSNGFSNDTSTDYALVYGTNNTKRWGLIFRNNSQFGIYLGIFSISSSTGNWSEVNNYLPSGSGFFTATITEGKIKIGNYEVSDANIVMNKLKVFNKHSFGSIKAVRVYDGNTLMKNFIPVTCGWVAGLYDTISKTLYKQTGTDITAVQ